MPGKLFVVATPIGNLEDMSIRALQTLRNADLIAAEDTRHTMGLLNHFEIRKPVISCHQFNEKERSEQIIDKILQGMNVALVSDAGTPAISDPGEILVRECVEKGVEVTAIPGACAFVTALSASGMPSRSFIFEGFLPSHPKERKRVLSRLKDEERTVLFYEAPHHLKETLQLLLKELGERKLILARELTKIHEERKHTTLSEAVKFYQETEPRGEYVLIVGGADPEVLELQKQKAFMEWSIEEHMKKYADMPSKEAMKKVAAERGISKREVYDALLQSKKQEG